MAEVKSIRDVRALLADRHARFAAAAPPIYWKSWAAVTVILAAAAMIWRDSALTIAARHEPLWLRTFAEDTTNIGKSGWILWLSAAVFVAAFTVMKKADLAPIRDKACYWATASAYMFLSVALSGIIANLVKRTIGRARPPLFDQFGAFHFQPFSGAIYESLPSGHATTDGAIAFALAVLFPRFRVPVLVLGALFAATRIMVGAHYLSDVIAGYSFGMWYAYMSAIYFAQRGFFLNDKLAAFGRRAGP